MTFDGESIQSIPEFYQCTVPAMKKRVIPKTLKRLFYITLQLRDYIFLEIAEIVDLLLGTAELFNLNIIKCQEIPPYDLKIERCFS